MAFGKRNEPGETQTQDVTRSEYVFGIIAAAIAMLVIATVAICARYMKKLHFAVIQINTGLFGVLCVGSLLIYETKSQDRSLYSYDESLTYFYIISAGIINALSQNIMVITMQRSNPAAISLYRYCGVFYGFFWDLVVFKRKLDFL